MRTLRAGGISSAVITHLAFSAGWPQAMSAMAAAKRGCRGDEPGARPQRADE
jgi:hypothetical protein